MANDGGQASPEHSHRLAVVRLAAGSVSEINTIDAATSKSSPFDISFECKQVPLQLVDGTPALLWLGSDNNKGTATKWKQGFRAVGRITGIERAGTWKDPTKVTIEITRVFDTAIDKTDIVKLAGANYAKLTDFPIAGVNNYSSQVVQLVVPDSPTQDLDAFLSAIGTKEVPTIKSDLAALGLAVSTPPNEEPVSTDDPDLLNVRVALSMGYAGAILIGPPGTGKSRMARRLAHALADGDKEAVFFVQFHPSYQYEDFVEGYVPKEGGGFKSTDKILLRVCDAALKKPGNTFVLVIDELSRCDAARVFGEALTYLERDKRNQPFAIASGKTVEIPSNVVILATMNSQDRGVDELDLALERRFAHINVQPDRNALLQILSKKNISQPVKGALVKFFDDAQKLPDEACHIGHAYFVPAGSDAEVEQLWNFQLHPFFRRACRFNPAALEGVTKLWKDGMSVALNSDATATGNATPGDSQNAVA